MWDLSSLTRDRTCIPYIGRWVLNPWTCSVCAQSLQSCVLLFVTLWTVAYQAYLSLGFSRQEHWNGLSCPSPQELPDSGIKPASFLSPASAGKFFTTSAAWEVPPPPHLKYLFIHLTVPGLNCGMWDPTGTPCAGTPES